jgi:hypothetical protein
VPIQRLKLTKQELGELMNQPLDNISVIPDESNLKLWQVILTGPVGLGSIPSVIAILTIRAEHPTPKGNSRFSLSSRSSSLSNLLK